MNLRLSFIIFFICFSVIGFSQTIKSASASTTLLSQSNGNLTYATPALVGMDGNYLENTIDSILQEGLDSMAFPGAQILIAKNGQIVFQKNVGFHTYDQQRVVQSTDLYDLASVTKVTTAVPALMLLFDKGLFDIDGKLGDYFPDFKGSNKAKLDFRSILAHQARLKPYIVFWQKAQRKNGKYRWWTFKPKMSKRYPIKITDQLYLHKKYKRKMMRYIQKSPLNEATEYVYSGLTFLMYPDLVKAKTGKQFDQFLYENLYKKIGAKHLVFNPLKNFPTKQIVPTENDDFFRNQLVHGAVHDEAAAMLGGISSNAGLFGNATDLAKLLQLYLEEGNYNGEQLIKKSTVQTFTACQYCDQGNRRGLGFDKPLIEYDEQKSYVAQSASPASYGHSGFTGTFFWVDPKEDLIFIFLSNRVHPTRDNRKLYTMGIRPSLHQAAYDAIERFKLKK